MSKDLDLLEGTWTLAEGEMDGQAMPDAMVNGFQVTIRGNRFTSTGMGEEFKGTVAVDESAMPRRLDMKFTSGPQKGTVNLCIYELKGDRLRMCIATRGTVRPARFESPEGSGVAVEMFVRGAAATKKKAAAAVVAPAAAPVTPDGGAATEFEGEWPMVSGVMNGAAMDGSLVKWCKRVTRGNVAMVMAGPQTMMKVEFTLDASQSPKAIDYLNLTGGNKGKRQLGIYKVEGEVATYCVAPPGKPRPAGFVSTKENGATLTVWKRP